MKQILLSYLLLAMLTTACQQTSEVSDKAIATKAVEGTRQVHLDFHNSEYLQDIGKSFDKEEFKKTLLDANVNSINIFAKCHHSWSYYNTSYGKRHPNLDFDLLAEQVAACKEAGIRVQAYITVGWSVNDAIENPEWVLLNKEGKGSAYASTKDLKDNDPYPTFTWDLLSPEGEYMELILKQTEELMANYDLDGIWFDIIPLEAANYSPKSLAEMKAAGIDVKDEDAVNDFHIKKMKKFMEACNAVVQSYKADASIFYNWSTHMAFKNNFKHDLYEFNTKLDLEDLPTTWAGYDVFPLRAKYFSNTGKSITGMSGKFHSAWGEFGGFKYPEALVFEAASMVAMGANVNFGDQLHPSGEIDKETYKNLKPAFDYVEKIEKWGVGGKHVSDIGIWMSFDGKYDEGLTRMLLENQVNFVVANNAPNWKALKLIILTGKQNLTQKEADKLVAFQKAGGKLIILGEGGLNETKDKFLFDFGAEYLGSADYDMDYTLVNSGFQTNMVTSPFLNYLPGIKTKIDNNVKVLASLKEPYFSREKQHYTSHQNTPYRSVNAGHPSVVYHNNILFIAQPLDRIYFENGSRIHRELFKNAIDYLLDERQLEVKMPSAGRVNLLHFPDQRRYVVHLLYGPPLQRGRAQVIEDLIPIRDVEVSFRSPQKIKKIYAVPSGDALKFKTDKDITSVKVPEMKGHYAISYEY